MEIEGSSRSSETEHAILELHSHIMTQGVNPIAEQEMARHLRHACAIGRTDVVFLILSLPSPSFNVNAADDRGRTALHFSAAKGLDEIVHALLDRGGDPFLKDANGNTALHLACCSNHIRVVTLLLHYGASTVSRDALGRTPLELAMARLKLVTSSVECGAEPISKLHADVLEVVSLLRECVKYGINNSCGTTDAYCSELDAICNGLAATTLSAVEIDQSSSLLMALTKMQLDA